MPEKVHIEYINLEIIADWTLQEELALQMRNVLYVIFFKYVLNLCGTMLSVRPIGTQ